MNVPDPQELNLGKMFGELNRLDKSFVPDFEKDFPPEYFEMLRILEQGRIWHGPVVAVWGFHFSPKSLIEISPHGESLYFFPRRPTISQEESIARLSATASLWNGRRTEVTELAVPHVVNLYAIRPNWEDRNTSVTVKPNAKYSNLLGLEVAADDSIIWQISGSKAIIVK